MSDLERFDGEVIEDRSTGYWYGYSISYDINRSPDDHHYKVRFFRQDYPTEEVRGQKWYVDLNYEAWFPTLEEARSAAKTFTDEMHWQREAEQLGVGRELSAQASADIIRVADELRHVAETDPVKLTGLFRAYDKDRLWELKVPSGGGDIIQIRSGTNNDYIQIQVLDRSYPDKIDYWDGNWLDAAITTKVGTFRCDLSYYLRTEDFVTFRDQLEVLYQTLSGSASLTAMEFEWLSLELTGDGRGHITALCSVVDNPVHGNKMQVRLEMDQTFLPDILDALNSVVTHFPVVGHNN